MSWLTILGLAVGLAMDALAVAIGTGLVLGRPTRGQTPAPRLPLRALPVPDAGRRVAGGRTVEAYIRDVDHWVAFGLLAFVGGKMLWEARRGEADVRPGDPTRGWILLVLSVATSIDALAVGLSMAFLQVSIWLPSAVIRLVAFAFTAPGSSSEPDRPHARRSPRSSAAWSCFDRRRSSPSTCGVNRARERPGDRSSSVAAGPTPSP